MEFPSESAIPQFPDGFEICNNYEKILEESRNNNSISEDAMSVENLKQKKVNISLMSSRKGTMSEADFEMNFDLEDLKCTEYISIFFHDQNSRKLIAKFEQEKKELVPSASVPISHSTGDCRERVEKGYYLFKYNFNNPVRSIVFFKVNGLFIELHKNDRVTRIHVKTLHGVLFGAVASTFRNFKKIIDQKSGKLHKFYQCFSLVTEFRTYDFATLNDSERMDIYIYVSLLISLNSSSPTSMPFTKSSLYLGYIVLKTINYKIRSAAHKRYMSVVELFMVIFK